MMFVPFGFGFDVEREKSALRPAFIEEKKKDIAEAFDQITGLEIGKPKPAN